MRFSVAFVVGLLGLAITAASQTPDERSTARSLVAKHGDAVVMVLGTTKIRVNQGGREVQNRDDRVQAMATVLDPSGLAVMSLSTIDPSELMSASLSRGRGAGGQVTVTTEPSELRYRLGDGREVPARLVLRDKDLDLAFLRPVEKPAKPMAAIDGPVGRPVPVDLLVILQRLPEVGGWQSIALFGMVQAVVDRPRTFYIMNSGTPGAPVLDLRGQFVGVILRLRTAAIDPTAAPPVIIPASDIREIAKQAAGP